MGVETDLHPHSERLTMTNPNEVQQIVRAELERFNDGFEQRLADAIRKALDTSYMDLSERVRALEEDMAKLQRHTGLS